MAAGLVVLPQYSRQFGGASGHVAFTECGSHELEAQASIVGPPQISDFGRKF